MGDGGLDELWAVAVGPVGLAIDADFKLAYLDGSLRRLPFVGRFQ